MAVGEKDGEEKIEFSWRGGREGGRGEERWKGREHIDTKQKNGESKADKVKSRKCLRSKAEYSEEPQKKDMNF